jgi:hypothetical protein
MDFIEQSRLGVTGQLLGKWHGGFGSSCECLFYLTRDQEWVLPYLTFTV